MGERGVDFESDFRDDGQPGFINFRANHCVSPVWVDDNNGTPHDGGPPAVRSSRWRRGGRIDEDCSPWDVLLDCELQELE